MTVRDQPGNEGETNGTTGRPRAVTAAFVTAAVVGLLLAAVPVGGVAGAAPVPAPDSPPATGAGGAPAVTPGEGCGDLEPVTHEGELSDGSRIHSYAVEGAENCSVTVTLSGPSGADFDLYLTTDGREPTPEDFDRKSTGAASTERIRMTAEETASASELVVLVSSYDGSGEYTLSIEPTATGEPTNAVPRAAFAVNATTVAPGDPVALNASNATDPDGSIERYRWQLGDGTTTTGVAPTHSFSEPGTYGVTLSVTDDNGTTATTTRTVRVEADTEEGSLGPVDSWYSPRNPRPGETTTFVGEPLGANVSADAFRWDFDGDGRTDATGRTASHAFASEGRHNVTLTVDVGDGNETLSSTVLVGSPDDGQGRREGGDDGPGNVTAAPGDGLGDVSQPGFGPGAAVGAVAVVLFGWRVREEAS